MGLEKSSENHSQWLFSNIFNLYDVFMLMVCGLSVLLIVPLLFKRERQNSDILLSAFIFSQGAMALFTVSMYNKYVAPTFIATFEPFHYIPALVIPVSQGFLLYHYVMAMTGREFELKSRINTIWLLTTIAAVIVGIAMHSLLPTYKFVVAPFICLITLPSIYMGFRALQHIWVFNEQIKDYFSNVEQVKLVWLRFYATGFVLVWILIALAMLLGAFGYYSACVSLSTFANFPPLLLMSGLVVHGQVIPLNMQKMASKSQDKTLEVEKLNDELEGYSEKVRDLMERVKIYQDPELRLDGLADSLDVSPRTVSTLLNSHYRQNFYDFINRYRLIDAQKQLSDPNNVDKPIQRIFEDAGFNSKTTFNTLFKKVIGKTPSEYRKKPSETLKRLTPEYTS